MEPLDPRKRGDPSKDRASTHKMTSTNKSSKNPTTNTPPPSTSLPVAMGDKTSKESQMKFDNRDRRPAELQSEASGLDNDTSVVQKPRILSQRTKVDENVTSSQTKQTTLPTEVNSGNDRVSLDKTNTPLVPSAQPSTSKLVTQNTAIAATTSSTRNQADSQSNAQTKTTPDAERNKEATASTTVTANSSIKGASTKSAAMTAATETVSNKTQATKNPQKTAAPTTPKPKSPASSSKQASSVQQAQMDEQAAIEEGIRQARAPLTDMYGSFIANTDTTLEDARRRLRTAIEQTRQLRSSFTERVYGKYRVCLRPPQTTEQILTEILSDPEYVSTQLKQEIKSLKEEKDVEKKEASKLNAEMVAATNNGEGNPLAAMNAENAEQLMFISAGLSLIVLPEQDVTDIDMSSYADRAPINPETGQRVRSISAAAAAAGEEKRSEVRKMNV